MWGALILIPAPGQADILQELNMTHPGISDMKALACSYVYWPGINKDIERLKCPTEYLITSLGVARQAMVPSAWGLCRTFPRAYVLDFS